MEGYRGAECDRASETSSFVEDEEEEEEEDEEEEEEEEEEAAVDPEEAQELTNSLKDVLQSEDVKPKLQYIMTNPSFSMVTVQSQDSGITWETSSSRSSTPWASETSTTSDLYSMEGSPVGSPPGKVIFIMDEGKIVRKRKRKSSNRVPMATSLTGCQGNKKRDSSGMQRQEPRTVLGDVQGSVLNIGQVETQDTDEEMLDDKEDLEDIAEEPVKRAPIRSIFRESRLRKVGPILGGPVQARIQLFNAIFGGIEPTPETLEKNRIQRSSSISGDSEQFLETSVRERLQKFRSLSEAMQRKTFQRARNRNLETPSERRREQRQQPTTYTSKSYSSPTSPLEKQLTIKEDISSENIKPIKMKDKPSRLSSFGAETALQHEERKDRQSLLETPNQVSGQSLKSCPPEEAKQRQSYPLVAKTSITEQSASISLESDAVSEKQVPVPETTNEEPDQSMLTASDLPDEPLEQEIQPNSAPQSVSVDFVNELGRQCTQPILPTASMSEHPKREAQKSAEQSYLANIPSSKSKYSAVSEARQEDIVPQLSEAAQSQSEHVLLPCSLDKTEKQETECHSSTTARSETKHSGQLFTVKKNETQKTPPQETENVQFKKEMESEEHGIKVNLPIPQKTDSKYFGISYPVHTETQETRKSSSVNKGVDLDHPDSSTEETKQVESAQVETEHPDFSYSSKEIEESEGTQMETEHPDFFFSKEETEELESLEHPDFSFSRGEMENSESVQLETEHPDFSYSREETEESECAKLETDYPELFFSTHEAEALENAQQQTEHPDVSLCKEETEGLESAQLETEHPDFSFSREEVEESGSTQLETEHPDISYSKGEMVKSESAKLEMEHPDLSFSREEAEELESAKLETGHPDFFYPRDEMVELKSAQLEMEHPDFSYSSKEMEESEGTQMETEHPDFSLAKEETEDLESAQLVTEHPDSSFSRSEMEELGSDQLEAEHSGVSYCKEETMELGGARLETEHPDVFFTEETEGSESAQLEVAHPDFSFSKEEAEESESSKLETGHPDFFYPRDEMVELKSAQLEMEHPDFSYSSKEMEESEGTQMETEHPDFSLAKEETEDLESAQLVTEHPDSSFSRAEMEELGNAQLEAEHPDVSYCKKESEELGGARLETEHPDVFFTEETEGSESAQLEVAHPDFSFSREETEELEGAHLETEHQEFSFSGNETEKPKSVPLELEQPETYSREEGEQEEKAQLPQVPSGFSCFMEEPDKENTTEPGLACPDISDSTRRAEAQQTGYLETAHSDLPFSTNKTKERELSQVDVDNSLVSYSGDKGEQQDSQPGGKLYSHAKEMQGETTQLWSEHPVLPYSTGKEQQPKTLQLKKEEREMTYSTGQTEQQEILQADMPCSHAEAAQKVVQKTLESPEPTHFISETQQHENVQLLSENRDFSFTTGEIMQGGVQPGSSGSSHLTTRAKTWEMAQLEQEQSLPPCSTVGSQEQETTPLEMVQPDLSYSFGRMEQDVVQGELEQQETVQQKAVQMGMEYSGLSETWGEEEPQAIDQITSAQPEAAQTEFVYSSLPYSPNEQMQEEMETEPAYPEQAFYVSTDMQEERAQVKSEQSFLSNFSGKTEQQEIVLPELEQTFLPPSTGKDALLEMEVSSEYPELSYSFHKTEQQKKLEHPTLPFRLKQEAAAPLVMEPSDFSCDSGEVKPGDTVQQESRHPELSCSMGETEGEAEHLDSPRTLGEAVQDECMEVEPKYSKLTCSDDQKTQQETSQLSSKYPDVSFSFGKAKEQGTHVFESKYRELPKMARKRASPTTAQMESKLPDFTCSLGQANEPEIAPWEEKHSDLSRRTDETNQQEVLDQKHRKISVGREKHETMKQQLEQEKLSHSPGKTEQLKHTQEDLEQSDLSFSIARPADEMAPPEADTIYPLDNTEGQQRGQGELKQTGLTYPFGKAEQKTGQPEVEIPCLAQSVRVAEEETAEHGQGHPDLPCSIFKAGGLPTAQLKPGHPLPAYSLDKVQETTQVGLEQPDVLHFHDKTEQISPAQLEGGHADLASPAHKVGQEGMEQTNMGHSDEGQPVSRAEHPQAAKERLGAPDALCHSGKGEQREMAKPEPKHSHLSYSIDKTQTQETTQLGLGQSVLASWPGKTGRAQTAQEEQPGFLYPLKAAEGEGEKEQSDLGHSQLPSVSEAEQETTHTKSNHSDLPVGRLEHREIIQPEPELMGLSCSTVETEQSQVSEVDSAYPDLRYSTGKIQEEENIQPEQKQPGDFSSSLSKEQKRKGAGMQVGHPELQGSMGKRAGLQSSQSRSEYTDLSLSVGTAEPPKTTQAELKEHDLLHSFVKTKPSWAAPLESEHPGVSDATGKVPHPDLSSSASEENRSAQLEVKQERGSDTLHPQETVQLNLEQPVFSSPHGTAQQPNRAPLEGEFPDLLYFSGEEEQREMVKEEMEHSGLSYSIDKTQQQETTKPELGETDFSTLSVKRKKPQTVQAEAEHQDLLHFTGKTEQQGMAQPEAEHPGLSYSGDKTEQPSTMEWKSEHPVTPHPIGKREQQGITHPEWESHKIPTRSQEAMQMDLEQQDLTYAAGKTDETQALQGELECTGLLYSSCKREQEMVLLELQQPQLFCPIREIVEEATHQKSNYPDLSFGQEHREFEQPELEEMDVSFPADKLEHSQPAQKVLHPEHLESFGKLEEKEMIQPGFLHSFGEEKQKPAPLLDLLQPGLSHSLGKTEKQETAQTGFMTSDSSYSTGKAEQLQTEQLKSGCLDLSYSLGKAKPYGMKPLDLPYSCVKTEQPQTVQLELPETSLLQDEMEHRNEAQPELQGMNLQYPVVETEQAETPSASYAIGRTEDWGTAQRNFGQSGLLSPTVKAEKHEAALLRAGLSEKQDTGAASSLRAQLETKQDLSFATEEAERQLYSSLTEQTASAPLGVSHSVSEIKPEGSPKSSPVTADLLPKHLHLSYTHCKTEQTEVAQPASSFFPAKKEAEKTKINLHLPVAAQPEAEHAILPETESEQTPHYFHTATQLESKQLELSYSTDKAETLESQDYLTVSSKLESEPSVPFYSADERCQQETSPYSKPTSEYLVPMWSLAQQEKQSLQPLTPQPAQSECKYVFPPHDEREVQKVDLCSSKSASLKMEQLESMSLMHTQDQDEQESQGHLWDAKYLSSDQLRSPPQSTAEQDKQKIQPEVQTESRSENAVTKVTGVAEQQATASDSFVPSHTLPENSVVFTDNEEKQNIASSLSNVVGMLGQQPSIISGIYTEREDPCEMQLYFGDQKHTSLEHEGAASSDLVYETVTHTMQHYPGEQGDLSSADMKSVSSSSDEMRNPDTSSFGLASWLVEEVKSHSISLIRAAEVNRQGIQLSPSETSDLGSKQFPAGSFPVLRVHGDTKNKGDMFRVSDTVSSDISHRASSENSHKVEKYDLPSLGEDNPGPEKIQKRETRIGSPAKMEGLQQPEVDKVPEGPEHYLRGEEEEMEHARAVEDSQHAPEPTEQKDLFNIISEGYEILNIHPPTHISSVDQEESKHLPDKLEYLETNPSFKRKLADDGHRALASGTTTETSEGSVLGKPASHELKELVKNDYVEEAGETQQKNPTLPENNNAVLDPNNGMADVDYFEKYTLIDEKSPIKPHFERTGSLFPVTEDPSEPVGEATSFKESAEVDTLEEEFSLLEDLDEVFYGTVKGESKMHIYADARNLLPLQKSIDSSSKKVTNVEDERKSPGTPLFDSEEGVLERSLLFPTTVAAVNPELLEEPPALSFLYKDLYAEAVGEKEKDETPSDEESGNSNASFPSRNSDTDDGTGIYFEKYILKDELPSKAIRPQKNHIPGDEPFSRAISVQSSEDKHKQGSGDVLCVQTGVLPERDVVEREKIQVDSNIRATICKPMQAIPFGGKEILSGARSDTTEQGEEENVPVETTEELPELSSYQVCSQPVDYQGTAYQEAAGNKQEEQHETTAIPETEKYVPYARTPVEDSEDDRYMQENLSRLPTIQQTEKPDLPREEQHPNVYEDLAESMDYDVITQEELLQDEISSQFTHEELLFEDRDSFEHIGDNYEFVNEPEQRTPVELEDSGFVVMYPEKSATNIPQVESPQRELKKVQADTYCYHCKCPISAIDKLFGEHKDHEVTTLDDAAAKMKDHLGELLIALEEKSMKIEAFVGDIESRFNSVEENCKKNAELLEKQNEEMLKNVVAQYDEKSDNFEEVKKMKMEYLYEQMVHFQQTVDSAKETLETTVKEMEELDGFTFLNSSKELNKRLLSAMDTTLSLEKVPSAFSLFEHYADSPGQTNQHSLKHVAVPQTPTVVPQEPNSATSTSIAVYWAVNDGDAIECFQVYCMEEPQASKDPGALVEEYRVTVKESHCILEDLEPDRCYSVWVMAVNGTGCSLPSEKVIFKTAPTVPTIKAEDCMVCWDMATVRWHVGSASVESFTLEYCRQHSPEGEGLRSFAGIKRPELKVSLEPNVNYFFYLRAVNPFGTSEQSEAALISTKGTRFRLLSDTAHPALQISSNATVVHLPEKAKFTGFALVLGELLPARGCHYWETVVSACRNYRIGICYEATSRSSILGLSDTSWCMRCCPTQSSILYRFLHTGVVSDVRVTEHPARIGILLDYNAGRLLFFNAERGLVLFTIRHKFTDAAYPAFALEKAGALTLHTGMEPPEFVKHG